LYLIEMSVQLHAPAALPLVKEAFNRKRRVPVPVWIMYGKFLALPGNDQKVRGRSELLSELFWQQ
jgi:hypothetical protein